MAKNSEYLWHIWILSVISSIFLLFFLITYDWNFIVASLSFSFIGIFVLWKTTQFFALEKTLKKIHKMRWGKKNIEKYLELRVGYSTGKNNTIIFSLLTYGLVLATIFNNQEISDVFNTIYGSNPLHGFIVLLITGFSIIYLIISTLFRAEFNRLIEIFLEDY